MNLVYTNKFKKDFKRMARRGYDERKLYNIVNLLLKGEKLPAKYADHSMAGNWAGRRDCHISPDWVLIYCIRGDDLILERTGTHSDLFS